MVEHGNIEHKDYYYVPSNRYFLYKKYYCPLNDKWYSTYGTLSVYLKSINFSRGEYHLKYAKDYLPDIYLYNINPVLGNARNTDICLECHKTVDFDIGANAFPAFCSFSCSTKWYAKNTDRVSIAMSTLKAKKKLDKNYHLPSTAIKYWTLRGLTEEEAIEKIRKRQITNSLEKFIERANGNIEEGTKKWKERQENWQKTMNALPSEEKDRIAGLKAQATKKNAGRPSDISIKLFDKIHDVIPSIIYGYSKDEKKFRLGQEKYARVDCWDSKTNKVIEFFGDYWHCNPNIFKEDYIQTKTKRTAKEIWERDAERIKLLKDVHNINSLIIWENEYRKDPIEVYNKCLKFLQE